MFKKALPVFPVGHETEMNILVGFYTYLPANDNVENVLRITGATQYKIFINGELIHHGPARTCHDKYRVDELKIGKYLTKEKNAIVIHLLSSNCACYSALKTEGFLQAEIECNEEIVAFTGKNGNFECVILDEHIQKTLRYTFQRTFSEVYKMTPEKELFNVIPEMSDHQKAEVKELLQKNLINRDLYYPEFPLEKGQRIIRTGTVEQGEEYK